MKKMRKRCTAAFHRLRRRLFFVPCGYSTRRSSSGAGDNYLSFTLTTYPEPSASGSTIVNLADTSGNYPFSQTYTDPAPGSVTADIVVAKPSTVNLFVGGQSEDVLSNVLVMTPEPSTALSLCLLAFGALA